MRLVIEKQATVGEILKENHALRRKVFADARARFAQAGPRELV
jgi:hypothetical protein